MDFTFDELNVSNLEDLKEACANAAGKAGKDEDNQKWLPLWMHMADTAGMMLYVLQRRTSIHQKNLILKELEEKYSNKEMRKKRMIATAVLLALLHDIGKMTAAFQAMIRDRTGNNPLFKEKLPGWRNLNQSGFRHHPAAGLQILAMEGFSEDFVSVVGAHHGYIVGYKRFSQVKKGIDMHDYAIFYGSDDLEDFWDEAWEKIVSAALKISGFESIDEVPGFTTEVWMIFAGLLIEADWLASNSRYFPLIPDLDSGSVKNYPDRWINGARTLDLPEIWHAAQSNMEKDSFKEMFSFEPNALQKKVLEIASNSIEPGIMIIEAQMGIGKTEAALGAADIYSAKTGSGGIYFALPTQATANGLFPRFLEWSAKEALSKGNTIKLAHGMADFNEDYSKIPRGISDIDEDGDNSLFIHEYMENSKTGLLSDFVIGTIDQGLMMALNHKYFMLKHLGLSSKTVIIDEVHAYDEYMTVYFDRMLEWLGSYQVPVILLSATLPSDRKKAMIQSYLKGRNNGKFSLSDSEKEMLESRGYPLITWTEDLQIETAPVKVNQKKMAVKVIEKTVHSESDLPTVIEKILKENLQGGGCAGVVLDTVGAAQKTASFLREQLPDTKILLFHSRFTAEDRTRIENEVLKLAGKTSDVNDRNRLVVVGTQVIEQSLDVDFDILISEIAPVDMLLQRAGRLHRHSGRKRPQLLENPKLYILEPETIKQTLKICTVYEPFVLLKTIEVLRKHLEQKAVLELPQCIPELVEEVYSSLPEETHPEQLLFYEEMENNIKNKERSASISRIQSPPGKSRRRNGLTSVTKFSTANSGKNEETAVRDIDLGVPVYLLRKKSDGNYLIRLQNRTVTLDPSRMLNEEQKRQLVSQKVTFPVKQGMEKAWKVPEKDDPFIIWRKDPMIRNMNFGVLDEKNEIELLNSRYHYSSSNGLVKMDDTIDDGRQLKSA